MANTFAASPAGLHPFRETKIILMQGYEYYFLIWELQMKMCKSVCLGLGKYLVCLCWDIQNQGCTSIH